MSTAAVAHNARWLPWLARGDRRARRRGDAERRQFPAAALSRRARAARRRTPTLPERARLHLARGGGLWLAGLPAADGRRPRRRITGSSRRSAEFMAGGPLVSDRLGPAARPRRYSTALAIIGVGLIGSSIARAAPAQESSRGRIVIADRSAEVRERARGAQARRRDRRRSRPKRRRAPISSSSACPSAPTRRSRARSRRR